jgi:YVTN family beta-propeller protein
MRTFRILITDTTTERRASRAPLKAVPKALPRRLRPERLAVASFLGIVAVLGAATAFADQDTLPAPLVLESKITLGQVKGRIDHLAFDAVRQRLYVAELGNDSVGVVDLKARKAIRTLSGFQRPQGIAFDESTDTLFVANAGDGSVRLLRGEDLVPAGTIELGDDADNVRVDRRARQVVVGYGSGALAVIDPSSRRKIADIRLKGHPEGFQLEETGRRIFVNVPDAHEIAVIDRKTNKQTESWTTQDLIGNFPLALDEARQSVLVMFRRPAKLGVFAIGDGARLGIADSCGDADDMFVDARRNSVYVSCGEGFLEAFALKESGYVSMGRVVTSVGARTARWIPEIDRLLVAVRATESEPAAIWVFRPTTD